MYILLDLEILKMPNIIIYLWIFLYFTVPDALG